MTNYTLTLNPVRGQRGVVEAQREQTSNGVNPPFITNYNLSLRRKIVLKGFLVLGILSIVSLLVFYIFQINNEVSGRYLIEKYERRISEIIKEKQNLEINSFQVSSLENIIGLLEPLNFEKTDKIHYIRFLDNQVVAK